MIRHIYAPVVRPRSAAVPDHVPAEFVGLARALRRRIDRAQPAREAAEERLLAPFRPRPGFQPMPRHALLKRLAAAWRGLPTPGRLMLAAGWPVSVTGQHGGTPLHWAGFHGNAEMAEIVLRHNPPLELHDADYNSTPLGWAIHGSENGWHRETGNYPATVEAILRAGAKLPEKIRGTEAVKDVLRRFGAKD